MNLDEHIKHWHDIYKRVCNIDERLSYSQNFYEKTGAGFKYQARPNKISSLLSLNEDYPLTPSSFDGYPMVGLNHPHRLVSLIREKEYEVEYIQEGLITTYPVDELVSLYQKFFIEKIPNELKRLSIGEIYKKANTTRKHSKIYKYIAHDPKNQPIIGFYFPSFKGNDKKMEEIIKEFVDCVYVCGYNLSHITKIREKYISQPIKGEEVELFLITLEAKFFKPEAELSETLYHVAPCRYFEKIRQKGLIPRSKSDIFKYPERIYLFNKASMDDIKNYGVKKLDLLRTNHSNPHVNDNGFYIFAVKREKLESYQPYIDKKTIFYYDPCYDGEMGGIKESKAIFTYNNIPRDLIENDCWYYEVSKNNRILGTKKVSMN
jgi:hypothetical protein